MKSLNPSLPNCVTNTSNLALLTPANRALSRKFLQALEDKLTYEAFNIPISYTDNCAQLFNVLCVKAAQIQHIKEQL